MDFEKHYAFLYLLLFDLRVEFEKHTLFVFVSVWFESVLKHITFLPKFFNIDFPEALSKELLKCKSNAGVKQVGIEWGIEQSKGLRDHGTPCLHYYTMGKSEVVKKIASEVF